MIAISYSVLNHRVNLLLIAVHVKHHVLYVAVAMLYAAVAMLRISLENVSFAIRLLRMMCFISARHFTWMSV